MYTARVARALSGGDARGREEKRQRNRWKLLILILILYGGGGGVELSPGIENTQLAGSSILPIARTAWFAR
jgi:hypothetical protein